MHYKKQLKRLQRARKQVRQQRALLLALRLEGITAVTFHTTTRQLTLPNGQGAAEEAADTYEERLARRCRELKGNCAEVRQLIDQETQARQQKSIA